MARRSEVGPAVEIHSVRDVSCELENIKRLLGDVKGAEWDKRVRALRKCKEIAVFVAGAEDQSLLLVFINGLRGLRTQIAAQVGDLRSAVVREACENLASMAECLGDQFGECLGEAIIPALLKTSAVTIQVISESGAEAMRRVLNSSRMPPAVIVSLVHCAGRKNANATRSAVAEYIGIILDRHPRSELDKSVGLLEHAVHLGLIDQLAEVRRRSRKNFCIFEIMYVDRAAALMRGLDEITQRAIAEEKGEGDIAPSPQKVRESARRRSIMPSTQAEPLTNGNKLAARTTTRLKARRVTTSGQAPNFTAAGASAVSDVTPARPGRIAKLAPLKPSSSSGSKEATDWGARISTLEKRVLRLTFSDTTSVEVAFRAISDSLSDPHVRVVAAALNAMAEIIREATEVQVVVERNPAAVARILTRKNHPHRSVRNGVILVVRAFESRLDVHALFSIQLKVLSGTVSGKYGSELSSEKSTTSLLEYLSECLAGADEYSIQWRASLLEGAARILAPLARGRSAEVRKGAAMVLSDTAALAPPGALVLTAETLEMTDRRTVLELIGDKEVGSSSPSSPPKLPVSSFEAPARARGEIESAMKLQLEQENPVAPPVPQEMDRSDADKENSGNDNSEIVAEDVNSNKPKGVGAAVGRQTKGYWDGILDIGINGDEGSAQISWQHIDQLLRNREMHTMDGSDVKRLCFKLISAASRFRRSSEAAESLEYAVRSLAVCRYLEGELVASAMMELLDNPSADHWNSSRLAAVASRLSLKRVAGDVVLRLFEKHLARILKLINHGRVDVRLASMELLAYGKSRLGDKLPENSYADELGPARVRVLSRYIGKVA
ncbi:hypothetical protein NDN08_001691 [Rhodosorus marinus]|uniref:CLASP N-terminal domain-containing protein n=1 Tax=Rhodosorus marinus TaxID=101924 RepID=A0AAV8UVV8_9RHOD|nr:hypothetical protein NDN08_001691 [Rhodosorus marinus]